ncbi:MAG TPA: DUF1611 domain-containing protein [Gemmatimonadaceae bacterium]|nr:DUF1611 domain-containing protein [Gemmatimonadaceae bacterium]
MSQPARAQTLEASSLPMQMDPSTRFVALAEGAFGPITSKTANGCIRYSPERVVAIIDSARVGQTAQSVLGFGGDIPVVAGLDEALALEPTALLVGVAPTGGQLPGPWRETIAAALRKGLDVWSGLHYFLADDPVLAAAAAEGEARIFDLRRPPRDLGVAGGRVREVSSTVVLTVGSDCNIGKMTSQVQLRDALRARGESVAFAATGQTGILVEGWGIAVDAVIADFISGAAERLVLQAARTADIVLVEGQGSIIHPSYSGVTYGLLHGSLPHAMVLCHQPSRKAINKQEWVKIPPLSELVEMYEYVARPLRPSKVIAIALNTFDLADEQARAAIAAAEAETGLPATDVVRYDPSPVADAILDFHRGRPR